MRDAGGQRVRPPPAGEKALIYGVLCCSTRTTSTNKLSTIHKHHQQCEARCVSTFILHLWRTPAYCSNVLTLNLISIVVLHPENHLMCLMCWNLLCVTFYSRLQTIQSDGVTVDYRFNLCNVHLMLIHPDIFVVFSIIMTQKLVNSQRILSRPLLLIVHCSVRLVCLEVMQPAW